MPAAPLLVCAHVEQPISRIDHQKGHSLTLFFFSDYDTPYIPCAVLNLWTPSCVGQVRFELGYYALKPDVKVVAPWRIWDLNSRTRLCAYAEEHGIDVPMNKLNEVRGFF